MLLLLLLFSLISNTSGCHTVSLLKSLLAFGGCGFGKEGEARGIDLGSLFLVDEISLALFGLSGRLF